MKSFVEKLLDLLGTLSPIIILVLASGWYLAYPVEEKNKPVKKIDKNEKIEKTSKQEKDFTMSAIYLLLQSGIK